MDPAPSTGFSRADPDVTPAVRASPAQAPRPRLTFNLCNVPAWALSDIAFQEHPSEVYIGRLRADNRRLFRLLDAEPDARRRGEIFHEYVSVQFGLHLWPAHDRLSRRCLRNSYVRYLRGWAADSNSVEGAVLKGWVASRMGIPPTFHHEILTAGSEAWNRYAIDRMHGQKHSNAIEGQLDMLYEFAQYELKRRRGRATHLTLYRGTFDAEAYTRLVHLGIREYIVELNNLSSFTSDRECAWEFGSTVWEVRVPLPKIFFFSDLLPDSILRGENEYMVIGGEYRVKALLA